MRIVRLMSGLALVLTSGAFGSLASIEYIVYQRPDESHYVFTDECIHKLERELKFNWSHRGDYKGETPLPLGFRIVTDPSEKSLAAIKAVDCVLAVEPAPAKRIVLGQDMIVQGESEARENLQGKLEYERAGCQTYGGKLALSDTYVGG